MGEESRGTKSVFILWTLCPVLDILIRCLTIRPFIETKLCKKLKGQNKTAFGEPTHRHLKSSFH